MANFGVLYGYELKKIVRRKIVWITAAFMLFIVIITVIVSRLAGSSYVDGYKIDTHYHMFQVDKEYQQRLSGRAIDQSLLEEMKDGYDKIPSDAEAYVLTGEYQIYARPYSEIFNIVRNMTNMTFNEMWQWTADEGDLYERRQRMLEEAREDDLLSQDEKAFWQEKEDKVEWPVVFVYKDGYHQLFDSMNTIGLMMLIVITICLSGVFAEEHSKRTDQLILCSRYGRHKAYWAKILAGISFSLFSSVMYTVIAFSAALAAYGADGFSGAFQLMYANYSYPLSVGAAILISYGMMIIAGILTGIFVMMLSELLHSSIGTLALVVGMIILLLFFNIPEHYRAASQLLSYIPSEFVAVWSIFSLRTVSLAGRIFTAWQIVPALYILAGGVFAAVGKRAYVRYQVSGR
ncbi:ABC-type Na+ efflux pump permease subunit [Kineothrix alysoides]|uniref:ABC-type Na+ efflux pump permease subunit n=1 Tax=Kineothrix alysoides TaxID=1469948 RepID=A0A4R1QYM7_9FIRM|nr:ABC transporter permease subunit [Kineothrix alysoides]TCL58063.1 ABC-type Na+ efflux pump permease subunit [Kineothrix alysoides]